MSESLFKEFKSANYQDWRTSVEKELKGKEYAKTLAIEVEEGIVVEPLYTKENQKKNLPIISLAKYESINEQVIHLDKNPSTTNEKALRVLNAGVNGITFSGSIPDYDYFKKLLNGIGIQFIQIAFIQAENYLIIANWIKKYCEEHKIDSNQIQGYFGIDPIGDYLQSGNWKKNEKEDFSELIQVAEYCKINLPQFRTLQISAELFHNAGASFTGELIYTSAILIEYIDRLSNAGLTLSEATSRLQINTAVGIDLLPEIAKLRAVRLLTNAILQTYPQSTEGKQIYLRAETSKLYSSAIDTNSNLLRASTEVYAMMCGTVQSICVAPYNESEPILENEFAERIARNIFLVLKEESYLTRTIDPAAGSYFIEELTQQLYDKSVTDLRKIESAGGILSYFHSGELKSKIDQQYLKKKSDFLSGKLTMIGTNKYFNKNETSIGKKLNSESQKAILRKQLSAELVNEKVEEKK